MTHFNRFVFVLILLGTFSSARAQFTLGTTALVEGPTAGADSVLIAGTGAWMATANDALLHTTSSGTGNGTAIFTYDANTGATRTGTLTIAGQTVTITQAGSTYSAAAFSVAIISAKTAQNPTGLVSPTGVAVDGAGNVYVADANQGQIKKWTPSSGAVSTPVTGAGVAYGVAVDGSGNIFVASFYSAEEWSTATQMLTPLPTIQFAQSRDIAVDSAGNIYVADYANSIQELSAGANSFAPLVSGLTGVTGIALDIQGNIYIADTDGNAIKMWSPATNTVTPLVTGLNAPFGVAVDGSGNVYFTDTNNNLVKKWQAATQTVSTVPVSAFTPDGIAVDASGSIYYVSAGVENANAVPRAFVDTGAKSLGSAGGSGALSVVLPSTTNLAGMFAPSSSNPSWLTLGAITNGIISYSFAANNSTSPRMANITVLGQSVQITQAGTPPNVLGTAALTEGPDSGTDSVLIAGTLPWTATANATWLHLDANNSSGTGNATVIFTYDANTGATRTGTLTIAGLTVTITQAGSTFVRAGISRLPGTTAFKSVSVGVAQDSAGTLYATSPNPAAVYKYPAPIGPATELIGTGLVNPAGIAIDAAGNLYIADSGTASIQKWTAPSGPLTTLVSSGLNTPEFVAVDSAGNVYISDEVDNAIKVWTAPNGPLTTIVSGLHQPQDICVDIQGNVYIADFGSGSLLKWTQATQTVSTLLTGITNIALLAIDGSGNVYMQNPFGTLQLLRWSPVTQALAMTPEPDAFPAKFVSDSAGNLISAYGAWPRAYVDTSTKNEGSAAGTDALSPVVPNTANMIGPSSITGPYTPTSNQPWLTIGTIANGVVNYSFTQNPSPVARTAYITMMGLSITVTQAGASPIVIMSGPTATPNPAGINQTIEFTAQASGGSGTLTYTWNFGDGSPTETGSNVTHAYTAIGTYPATLTVNDTSNAPASATIMITVDPPVVGTGNDSDGDGFSDSFETAVGFNPDDPASTPTGSIITFAEVKALTILKASIKVGLIKPGKDSIAFAGTLPVPAGFNPNGAKVYFYAGGVIKALTLTSKGGAKSGGDSVKLSIKTKKHVVLAQNAKYSVKFMKGTFAATLAEFTGINNQNAKKLSVTVPFTFIFDNLVFQKTQSMLYTAKLNKTGMAK